MGVSMDIKEAREREAKETMRWADETMMLSVDFDGVIHQYSRGWDGGKIYDPPMPGAVEGIARLESRGYIVVVFTARDGPYDNIKAWLKEHGLGHLEVTNRKIPCRAYIDDRAIRFTNWKDIVYYFT
jgi:phosphoglycolate phosphatase-like HAD superfamily hydrolase